MADFDDDDFLVTAIDNAPTHANNDYWKWSPETRAEYKQWHAAKQRAQQQQQVQIPATVSEDEGEGDEPAEAEEEVAEEAAEVDEQAEDAKPKKEPSRWVQYQAIARAELIEETPGSKPKLVEVNKRARAMYIEDGWSK
jgi:hypothetical protein